MYSDFLAIAAEVSGSFIAFVVLIKGLSTSASHKTRFPLMTLFVACFTAFLLSLLHHFIDSWRVLNAIACVLHLLGGTFFVRVIDIERRKRNDLPMHRMTIVIIGLFLLPAVTIMSLNGAYAIGFLTGYGEILFAAVVFYFLIFSISLFGGFVFLQGEEDKGSA